MEFIPHAWIVIIIFAHARPVFFYTPDHDTCIREAQRRHTQLVEYTQREKISPAIIVGCDNTDSLNAAGRAALASSP